MTFHEAYRRFGPDTMAIAEALSITEAQADRLINKHLDAVTMRIKARERSSEQWQRRKAELAELRAERSA